MPLYATVLSVLSCSVHLFLTTSAYAWGTLAHRVIAHVAFLQVSSDTRSQVSALLGSQSLVEVASAADEWRSTRPETSPWHYVNIPFSASTYEAERDCPQGNCIIAAIARYHALLSDHQQSQETRREALIFLVHFLADIHQPLHCIDNHDRGGNDVAVTFFGVPTNLHAVWDNAVLQRSRLRERGYTHRLRRWLATQNTDLLRRGTPVDWALEAHGLARTHAYHLPPDHDLRSGYYSTVLPIVEAQMAKAALRLASLLDTAF